ncbi:hypothetical protein [Lacimicrobium alkaliphilum]|uniref:Uncharacterized protein n=1 Tax=Lacimicrobium alkaliphilum TaxID=1526571 RepID=A0A0U3AMY5_9ALTE|nr:hypothetical protein [Lacimicrobium alkaliphilum]ALS99314.1 hypothetical protein AT746_14310 [Lacimicrobium alkaliphilum]
MKEILGKHRQDFDEIRRLCLICHGLDLSTSSFSFGLSEWTISESTSLVLQNVVSSHVLQLAIALRTNLYQKRIPYSDEPLAQSSWLYYDEELRERPATLKQVCDKIIHADSVSKNVYPKVLTEHTDKICTQFKGKEFSKGSWTMNVAIDVFAEEVLHILDEIEQNDSVL